MKKYRVKFYCVDYRIAEMEVEADSPASALTQGQEMIDSGEANYELDNYKEWKKPTVRLIRGKK